jgi:hypothetical protein
MKRLLTSPSTVAALLAALVTTLVTAGPARAWDPATTQAGLTERALLASSFHKALARRLGRPLGAFEPLALHSRLLGPAERQTLWSRLTSLDPAGGYRPDGEGVATAMAWVTAGAVLAETPPERGRNHFFDPRTGRGLDDDRGLAGSTHALKLTMEDGGSLRGLATGTVFDLTGKASLGWTKAPENDLGLPVFHQQLARSVSAVEPVEREAALVRALLAMGGVLAALQDAGEPAHVRNDFRQAYLAKAGSSSWDRASRFERFVSERYGRTGVPAPREIVRRPTFDGFFAAPDGGGLADRTQRRFFSDGTVPDDVAVDEASTPREVVEAARASLPYPAPDVGRLDLRAAAGEPRYVTLEGRRALGYEWFPGRVHFFLDQRVYSDAARVLLPEVAGYAAGLVEHLLRGSLTLTADGGQVAVALEGVSGGRADGKLQLYSEDSGGRRQLMSTTGAEASATSFAAGSLFTVAVPAGAKKIAAVLVGSDAAGDLVAFGEIALP